MNEASQPSPQQMSPHNLRKFTQKRLAYLERVEADIQQSENELSLLKNQESALKQRRSEALASIKEESERKLKDFRYALEKEKGQLEAENTELITSIADKTEQLETIDSKLQQLKESITNNKTDLEAQQEALDDNRLSIVTLERSIELKENEKEKLETQVKDMELTIIKLENEKIDITAEIEIHKKTVSTISISIEDLQLSSKQQEQQLTNNINKARMELRKTLDQLKSIAGQDRTMRESLAEKELILRKKEEVLRRRELLVEENQSKIDRNANLLQL